MNTILQRVRFNGGQLAGLVLLLLVSSVAQMVIPAMMGKMIDNGINQSNPSAVYTCALIMAVLAAAAGLASIFAIKLASKIATGFAWGIRKEIFYKVQTFSSADMDRFGTASLITRSTSDVTTIQLFVQLLLNLGIMAPLMAVSGMVLSALTGGKLASVLVIGIPVLVLCITVLLWFLTRYSDRLRKMVDRINKLFLESLQGARVIRAFNRQSHEMKRFETLNGEFASDSIIYNRLVGSLLPVIHLIFGLTTTGVLILGCWMIANQKLEVGSLIANSQYITMILSSILMVAAVIIMAPNALTCAGRIALVLNTVPALKDGKLKLEDRKGRNTVQFKNVTFAYPGADEPVLENITFESGPGEVTAIIGRTGCGKSSILKLIPRTYEATTGHIYIDGEDIRSYRLDELRSIIGYVPQKNVLFSGDVASNLNFGVENGTESQWEKAAQTACAKEFIDEKEGTYHSAVSQGGTNLSGGQRQRMAIARAIMKEPEIYLFDDSFSALDMKTDRQLRQNLFSSMGNATVIMVAQRISSIQNADRILVLDEGRIVGNGTHKELLKTCPLYREIAVLQLGEEALSDEE
ncbi:MAG: ABC transporter ATP-binding protein [Erysipelotrichaceae bacterium]|nr:ABC transporter ATP-binding protein [Erysipelotrichaceae bacterium]